VAKSKIRWDKIAGIVAAITAANTGLEALLPPEYHAVGMVISNALTAGLAAATNTKKET
jgi:hypothetical protein